MSNHQNCSEPNSHRQLSPDFEDLLCDFDLDSFDAHDSTIYGIRRDLTIGYVNATWTRFALENNAPCTVIEPEEYLNKSILDSIYGPLRSYYQEVFENIFTGHVTHDLDYECSTPHQIRFFHMQILPLPESSDETHGLLVINSYSAPSLPADLRVSVESPNLENYISTDGFLTSCSNCRRFQRSDQPDRWNWIPCYLHAAPAPISHGLCPVCLDYYYPAPVAEKIDPSDEP